jgi:hypothetical protein
MMRYALNWLHDNRRHPEYWTSLYVVAWCYERDLLSEQTGQEPSAYDVHVTYSGRESLRRAVKNLERDGLVETCQRWYEPSEYPHWSGLHYRLTEAERAKLSVDNSPTLNPEEASEAVAELTRLLGT